MTRSDRPRQCDHGPWRYLAPLALLAILLGLPDARGDGTLAGTWLMEDDYAAMAEGQIVASFEVVTFAADGTFQAGWWHAGQPYARVVSAQAGALRLASAASGPPRDGLPDWSWPFPVYAAGRYDRPTADILAVTVEDRRDVLRDRRDLSAAYPGTFGGTADLAVDLHDDMLVLRAGDGPGRRFRRVEPQTLVHGTYLAHRLSVSAMRHWRCSLEVADRWLDGTLPAVDGIDPAALDGALGFAFEELSTLDDLMRKATAALPPAAALLETPDLAEAAVRQADRRFLQDFRLPNLDRMRAAGEALDAARAAFGGDFAPLLYSLCPDGRRRQLAELCMAADDAPDLLGLPQGADIRDLPDRPSVADRTYRQCACLADATLAALPQDRLAWILPGLGDGLAAGYASAGAGDLLATAAAGCRQ
ncbi:MAG: hypothetical protein H6842_07110 [Rhodospirillaceae bacterium]|nr:hypothetical protein [Rhodospirillaceae bacterium]